jgi:hypothetical protein
MPITDARTVLLEILRQADGEWSGRTRLHKVFYFAHLYHGKNHSGMLTDWPFVRMPQGPGIHDSHKLFGGLIDDGLLVEEPIHEGPYPEHRYRLTEKGKTASRPQEKAVRAIEEAVQFCADKTAEKLSEITHEHSRSWNAGNDGDILNIDLDLIPEGEYRQREEALRQADELLAKLFPEVPA